MSKKFRAGVGLVDVSLAACFLSLSIRLAAAAPLAYVANAEDDNVSIIDTVTRSFAGLPIGVGRHPDDVAINPAGTRVYVANEYDDSVSVIDTSTNAVIATISGMTDPGSLVISADGSRLFVAAEYFVYEIDTSTNLVVGDPIAIVGPDLGGCPRTSGQISVNAAGTRVYVPAVTCSGDVDADPGYLSVIDVATHASVANIEVGRDPTSAVVGPAGDRVYVTSWDDGLVTVIDAATNTVIAAIPLGVDHFPYDSVLDPTGRWLYVSNNGAESLSVVDTSTQTVAVSGILLGAEALGVAISSDGQSVYATLDNGTVATIDAATRTVVGQPVAVGNLPISIAVARTDALFADGFESR